MVSGFIKFMATDLIGSFNLAIIVNQSYGWLSVVVVNLIIIISFIKDPVACKGPWGFRQEQAQYQICQVILFYKFYVSMLANFDYLMGEFES